MYNSDMPATLYVKPETQIDQETIANWEWRLTGGKFYKIQTKKAGKLAAFKPTRAQRRVIKHMKMGILRYIILKCRQIGISTLFLLWHLDATIFTANCTTVILAHDQKALRRLFKIIKIAYENMPDSFLMDNGQVWHKPLAKYDTKYELEFEGINSRIYVALEVRSETIHRLHGSEVAFIKRADDVMTATLNAVPDGGVVSLESTANGVGGLFYEMWEDAVDEQTDSPYLPLFFGPQHHPEYRDDSYDLKTLEASLDSYEKRLRKDYGVPLAVLAWARRRKTDPSARKKFKQEYPFFPREAFLHTGKSAFDQMALEDWIITHPLITKMEGRMMVWEKAVAGRRYGAVLDTASGRGTEQSLGDSEDVKEGGTDYSVIQIWDLEKLKMVAMFRAKWPYAKCHEPLLQMAREYNNAYIIVEATDHGLTVLNNLEKTDYPQTLIHSERVVDKKTKTRTKKWGFYTNNKSRPLIIDELATNIEEGNVRVHSRRVQSECFRFIIHDDGKPAAMDGYKDDCVMAMAIMTYPPNISCALQALRTTIVTKRDLKM